jgi:hypothetical protein
MPISTFLNGGTASQLRGLAWLAMSETGIIQRGTALSDSGGGATQTWAAVGTVDCRIDPINRLGSGQVTGGQIDERSTHLVTTPTGTTVVASDRFAIAGRGTFEITAVHETTAELAHNFEVLQIS